MKPRRYNLILFFTEYVHKYSHFSTVQIGHIKSVGEPDFELQNQVEVKAHQLQPMYIYETEVEKEGAKGSIRKNGRDIIPSFKPN